MLCMALKLYLVTCNFLRPGDYLSLKERLRTYTASQLKEIFRQLMDERDRIVIAEVGAEWASRRALVNMAKL
jgi:hypothetical protein